MDFAYVIYIVGTILILPAVIFALVAQAKVHSAFNHYSKISSARGITAGELAKKLLMENECSHVSVEQTGGHLSDHYDPRKKVVRLSSEVYGSTSLAALGIAAHEVGHAIQDHTNYPPLKIRQIVVKSTSLINKLLIPLIIVGLIASLFAAGITIMGIDGETFFLYLMLAFCIMYGLSFLINVITLPTEFNASSRAKKLLRSSNVVMDEDEAHGISKVLGAAALTYVAGLVVSLAYFLRFLGLLLMMSRRR